MTTLRLLLLLMILAAGATPGRAAFEVLRMTMDAGGEWSSSPDIKMVGTIAQWDAAASSGGSWRLRGGFWARGSGNPTSVETPLAAPAAFQLHPNVPNPFNPTTTIAFDVPRAGRVVVDVYNLRGERVRRLTDGTFAPGRHATVWHGLDDRGAAVASGVYVVKLRAEGFDARRKITLLK